ncbi:MAG: beta-ketoacyl-[acyl-carrier-protein] synthase family protein [Hyphomicrobiales bacterium]|nr:beta-ketoacyl-[acyl-carrier-protein] synthase family protein [Hyphomicrobiales bacterium]
MHRVVITGIGVVSPAGCALEPFWSALVEGRSAIGPLTVVPTDRLKTRIAAQVAGFDPEAHFPGKQVNYLDKFSQFAVVAATAAVKDAGVAITPEMALGAAVVVGNGAGGQSSVDEAYLKLYGQNSSRLPPLTIPKLMPNAAASQISMNLGLKGPTWSVATACASATHAIGQAFHMVRSGQAPLAVTGGAEGCLTVGTIKAWEALHVLSSDTCRPFSATRSGIVLSEGAAMMVLETREAAASRGARVYAEVLGFGQSADAGDITAADADGCARAMQGALRDACLNGDAIDYVNAHGTGTDLNDRTETRALHMVFANHARRLTVSSSKAVLGHSLGASGAFELAAAALALQTQTIPPTANFEKPDPECDLDYVPNVARQAPIRTAMSNSFAFGGLNAVIVLGRA